ncbi:hypothetical protein BX616_002403 [Lobosporangium transversale]|uniref:poly(ADP-ribose) glycohydrolase n=1 Tax=Lobosporangium transversale TaxID=64571 RepID=A0A1Y2GZT8_9FUNG|nr:hypothetical protein BCR41DRAFT_419077 [Lobosporangium transversale]KAF9919055.1 hypothetical protein BX616_002403 [Lobosporangium transversale]ORZ27261.1 hypothetical protein BCR41DRAFT_419077 [Lobosporangium transversale]|eukprot:XP_021884988.1 hypothetical protein BCR41DRAFT_419077 [Lobosporangium transversale]
MASSTAPNDTSISARSIDGQANAFFETGPNYILCEIPGINDDIFPKEYQDSWDKDHVRLPCSNRMYPSEVSFWPEIVQSLSEPILSSRQLSEAMLRWNPTKRNGWNINALDAFLNTRSAEEAAEANQGMHSDEFLDPEEQQLQIHSGSIDSDEYLSRSDGDEDGDDNNEKSGPSQQRHPQRSEPPAGKIYQVAPTEPLKSQFLSSQERQHFFDVVLPRMQALALRLPELIKKPIPFLKQQQDSAVTLSQEQIACLLANAFFNTFPGRNAPYKTRRKKRSVSSSGKPSGANTNQNPSQDDGESTDEDEDEEDHHSKGKKSGNRSARDGRNGGRGGGGAGQQQQPSRGKKKALQAPRPPRKPRAKGPAALFEFFEDSFDQEKLASSVEKLEVNDQKGLAQGGQAEIEPASSEVKNEKEWAPKLPSINFISTFWAEEKRTPCTTTQAARLRCILHYFDRVTTEMPQGTVTYHRQVLKRPVYLNPNDQLKEDSFKFTKVIVDSITPIEEAPQGALQLDFANRNIGGGTLDKGAVQEEIRFMICPELIVSRLFTQQLEANEAVLIKGAERYSNYIGYSKSFEWYSDHRDTTPRDKIGRRMTEICAIDARPFKSRVSRLEQFERHYLLREINKAIAGYRVSPINASEWGLARPQDRDQMIPQGQNQATNLYRPIATGNWGCGAFGGHLQLKFVLQWIAASICGAFHPEDQRTGDDLLYYTFGMHALKDEIEAFVKAVEAINKPIEPKRVIESIIHYPRRNQGVIQGFREKSLFEYLSSAIAFVPQT